ncbi:MAG TPA: XrtA system polysaccharide chain length determinant [Allosphingosinicella sp.]|jgi:polysaccharide chain length determinant protein (PEP-CTERM system associated)
MDGLYEQLRIALHQVWRRRWLALAVAWALCLAGWLVVALIPNSYESRARVHVQIQAILPTQMGIPAAEGQNDLVRVRQTLTSTENLQRVVRRTELNSQVRSERDLARQVEALRERIEIVAGPDNMFEISATADFAGFSNGQNARTATAIVQALLDLFVEENLAGGRTETGQSLTFLDAELRRRETQLQEAEQRRVEFEQRYMGQLPGEGSIASRMAAARMELGNIEQQLVAAQSAVSSMRAQLGATPQTLPGLPGTSGGGGAASSRLAQLEMELSGLQGRGLTDQHPDVMAARAQIARLAPQAAAERRSAGSGGTAATPNPSYVSLRAMLAEREAQVTAATMRRQQINADLQQLSARQSSEPGVAAEQARLNRDYDVLKQQYDRLLADREQIRLRTTVRQQTDMVSVRVIDPPSRPVIPAAPNRPLFLTMILFVAVGAGIAAAFVRGQLQTTFPTQNRLAAATGLPVFGAITEVVTAAQRSVRRQRLRWLAAGVMALGGAYGVLMAVEFWQRSTVA